MITHENLVDAVYRSNGAWSCPNGDENCLTDYDCMECTERLVKEYENALRADERNKTIEKMRNIFCEDLFNRFAWDDGTMNFNNCSLMMREIIEKVKEGEENDRA